jgi:hypothetical protein
MRLAWFAAEVSSAVRPLDDTPSLVAELGSRHEILRYDERRAPDFVWHHWREPFDLCVYELGDTAASAFVWPYLLHYPGVLRLRSTNLQRSRAGMLHRTRRLNDAAVEAAFAGFDGLRIPLLASRLTVVGDAYVAGLLESEYPAATIRHAPPAVARSGEGAQRREAPRFAVAAPAMAPLVERAAQRARESGCSVDLMEAVDEAALGESDAVIALEWPPAFELPVAAMMAMAAGRPAIVYETTVSAAWPTLDPQTWQPRSLSGNAEPIAISIDPLDEEHSLMLAIRRLATDASLRQRLGHAGEQWWRANATPGHAATAWDRILEEAIATPPPRRPADWPVHLDADGTERARQILGELGVTVDFLS